MTKAMDYLTQGLINKAVEEVNVKGIAGAENRIIKLISTIEKTQEIFGNDYDGSMWKEVLRKEIKSIDIM